MTKAVADSAGVRTPSFGGYIKWSVLFLVPNLVAMVCIFIADGLLWTAIGIAIALAIVVRAVIVARQHIHPTELTMKP